MMMIYLSLAILHKFAFWIQLKIDVVDSIDSEVTITGYCRETLHFRYHILLILVFLEGFIEEV